MCILDKGCRNRPYRKTESQRCADAWSVSVCFPRARCNARQLGDTHRTWAQWVGWRSSWRTAAYYQLAFLTCSLHQPCAREAVLWKHMRWFLPGGQGPLQSRAGWSFIACRVRRGWMRRRVFQLVGEESDVYPAGRGIRVKDWEPSSHCHSQTGLRRGIVEVQWGYSPFQGHAQIWVSGSGWRSGTCLFKSPGTGSGFCISHENKNMMINNEKIKDCFILLMGNIE